MNNVTNILLAKHNCNMAQQNMALLVNESVMEGNKK